jgi:hypothetical protein
MFIPGMLPIGFWFEEFFWAGALFLRDAALRRCIPDIFIPGMFIPDMLLMSCFLAVCLLRTVFFFFRDDVCDLDFAFGLFVPGMLCISRCAKTGTLPTVSTARNRNIITRELNLNKSMPLIVPPGKVPKLKRMIKQNSGVDGGAFDVQASAQGYQTQTHPGVTVTGGAITPLNFSLNPVPTNLALNQSTLQSSTAWGGVSSRAVDGNTSGNWSENSVTHTVVENQPWWQVDLATIHFIQTVHLWNRTDCCGEALTDFYVFVSDEPFVSTDVGALQSQSGVTSYHISGTGGVPTAIAVGRTGRYLRVQLGGNDRLSLAEVQVWGTPSGAPSSPNPQTNLALSQSTLQSSTAWGGVSSRAVDGNTSGNWSENSVTHTVVENQPWWQVDLGDIQSIETVQLWNRTDCCGEVLIDFYVFVSDEPFVSTDLLATQNQIGVWSTHIPGQAGSLKTLMVNRAGRYVRVQLAGYDRLSLAEVQVWSGL